MKKVKLGRKLDLLGRVTIPADIRKDMELDVNDDVEFYYDEKNKMFGVKSASLENQAQRKIDDLVNLAEEIEPESVEEVTRLLKKIKKILGIQNKL